MFGDDFREKYCRNVKYFAEILLFEGVREKWTAGG
jgi:hypothetical protein